MTTQRKLHRFLILAPAVFCVLGSYSAPLHGQTLIEGPLGHTTEPTMSLFILDMPPGSQPPLIRMKEWSSPMSSREKSRIRSTRIR